MLRAQQQLDQPAPRVERCLVMRRFLPWGWKRWFGPQLAWPTTTVAEAHSLDQSTMDQKHIR
jgi:hypothetical protein